MLITTAERQAVIERNAAHFGWDLAGLRRRSLISVEVALWPTGREIAEFDAALEALGKQVEQFNATRVAFDPIDPVLESGGDPATEIEKAFHLRDWLLQHDLSGIVTADFGAAGTLGFRRHAFLQVLADCSVVLHAPTNPDERERRLTVLKYRGSSVVEEELSFVIGMGGIEMPVPPPKRNRKELATDLLHPELLATRDQFAARLRALDRFLEVKQAEMDFFLDKDTNAAVGTEQAPAGSEPSEQNR